MSDLLEEYSALSSSSSRTEVANVLDSIINASPFSVKAPSRRNLVQQLLTDVHECAVNKNSKGRLVINDAAKALLATKMLGKNPTGSEVIARAANLTMLLAMYDVLKSDPDANTEALRCVANALLLIDSARPAFVSEKVGGGKFSVALLDRSTTPDQLFLASRILFLCTVSSTCGNFIQSLVEEKSANSGTVIDIIGTKLDLLTTGLITETKMAREATTDILKFIFNLLVHYPKLVDCEPQDQVANIVDDTKVMGDFWSPKLDGLLAPLLRLFKSLPPLAPGPLSSPLAETIHSLITIPVSPSLRHIWLGGKPLSGSGTSTPRGTKANQGPVDRALAAFAAGRRSLSLSRSGSPTAATSNLDLMTRVHELLDGAMAHYLPDTIDPDNIQVRDKCKAEGDGNLDDIMSPLVLLVSRLSLGDEAARVRFREILLPADLDRTRSLESRNDLLGRCLRLLGSVHHARLRDSVGEMLFAICDSDPATLSAQVGYGNVAGFLFNKGVISAPTQPSNATLTTPSGEAINPITGTLQGEPTPSDMTDEEKEREAEKLMVLFDRMERTGAIGPGQNPIRQAVAKRYS